MVVNVALLAALTRVLLATGNPHLCAGIYASLGLIFAFCSGAHPGAALLATAITFVLATIYFWLLHRYEERTFLFWVIFASGIFLGFV